MNQLTGGAHMLHRISFLKEIPMENKMETFYRREKKNKKKTHILIMCWNWSNNSIGTGIKRNAPKNEKVSELM